MYYSMLKKFKIYILKNGINSSKFSYQSQL